MYDASPQDITKGRINGIKCNVLFLCAVDSDEARLDLRHDGMGVWIPGHKRVKEPFLSHERCSKNCDSYVWQTVWTCKAEKSLNKTEIFRRARKSDGSVGELISPILIQYSFQGPVKDVQVKPHGNSQNSLAFYPSNRSLLRQIKERAKDKSIMPLQLYMNVSSQYNDYTIMELLLASCDDVRISEVF